MTLLCLDCGNTRLKWGLNQNDRWLEQGALPLTEIRRLPETLSPLPRPERAIACNVAGALAGEAIAAVAEALAAPLSWARSRAEQCGVRNSYDVPSSLGADRWAALIGARSVHRGACLVVNAGTATTIDVLDAKSVFRGGLILPGIDLMRAVLAGNTAQLPLAAGVFRDLPRNTADAIASGSLQATAGAIERMFARLSGQAGAICLLSGGAAENLAPLLDIPLLRIDNLVLEGLVQLADEQGLTPAWDTRPENFRT